MSVLNRLKKYAGLNKDRDRCPSNPCITVRETIEIADHIKLLAKQRDELRAFAEEVRRSGDTRLASMAIAVISSVKGGV